MTYTGKEVLLALLILALAMSAFLCITLAPVFLLWKWVFA